MLIRSAPLLLGPLLIALAGCPTKQGELYCQDACSHQEELTFCDVDGVYPGTELRDECILPPSPDACNRVELCTTAEKPYCTDASMGVCVECETGEHCDTGEVCTDDNVCEAFSCTEGSTGDAACAEVDVSQPYCAASETCVACLDSSHCTTTGSGICDEVDFECRGCEAHSDCDSKVCDFDSGVCADSSSLVYVSDADGSNGSACGTVDSPCLTITEGLTKVTSGRETVLVGAGTYGEKLDIGDTVTIVADGAVTIDPALTSGSVIAVSGAGNLTLVGLKVAAVSGTAGTDGISCGPSTTLALDTVEVTGARDIGVVADTCDLSITGSTIFDNDGVGVTSSSGSLSITGSTISVNDGGGLDITNSDFSVVNNFIAYNGSNSVLHAGVVISNTTSTQVFDFNTVVGNQVSSGTSGVICSTVTPLTASGNIVYDGVNGSALSGGCNWAYSNIEGGAAGEGNIDSAPLLINNSAMSGDYHLQSGSPGINAADPAATLATDFDGDARPQGGRHDMGADEVE